VHGGLVRTVQNNACASECHKTSQTALPYIRVSCRFLIFNGRIFRSAKEAQLSSLVVPMDQFVRGRYQLCDVYVIDSYNPTYNDTYAQQILLRYVAGGKGLMVAGPDQLPSKYLAPDSDITNKTRAPAAHRRLLGGGKQTAEHQQLPELQQLQHQNQNQNDQHDGLFEQQGMEFGYPIHSRQQVGKQVYIYVCRL
jgi:hypothetical protein